SFLIERFAIAVTPGLTLMEPKTVQPRNASLLLSGLSEARTNFPALQFVPVEAQSVRTNYSAKVLLNRDFQSAAVANELTHGQYSLVHFATHAQFKSNASETFLVSYDGRLTMDDLERFIRPSQFRGQPVELLTLSACETAAGDERAALGLAGVAIKSGARSALATLWCVNDQAASLLV